MKTPREWLDEAISNYQNGLIDRAQVACEIAAATFMIDGMPAMMPDVVSELLAQRREFADPTAEPMHGRGVVVSARPCSASPVGHHRVLPGRDNIDCMYCGTTISELNGK